VVFGFGFGFVFMVFVIDMCVVSSKDVGVMQGGGRQE